MDERLLPALQNLWDRGAEKLDRALADLVAGRISRDTYYERIERILEAEDHAMRERAQEREGLESCAGVA